MACSQTQWPWEPLVDCSDYIYAGHDMGLYGQKTNIRPNIIEESIQSAISTVDKTQPFGVALIGQSTALTTFTSLLAMPEFIAAKNPNAKFVNCAHGGYQMEQWSGLGSIGWSYLAQKLLAAGLTASQIKIIILINTFPLDYQQNLTDVNARLAAYATRIKAFRDTCKVKLPNNVVIYCAGLHPLYQTNAEPGAGYETGLAFRDAMLLNPIANDPPLLAGWYQWSKGATPNADGTAWICSIDQLISYYLTDGIHQTTKGASYGASLLFNFLNNDSSTSWFR